MSDTARPDRGVLTLLGDEHAQEILRAASRSRLSANALSERCDASLATVYRRIERLVEYGLLVERTRVDDSGNHYNVYEAGVERVDVTVADGELDVALTRTDRAADRFTSMWESFREDES